MRLEGKDGLISSAGTNEFVHVLRARNRFLTTTDEILRTLTFSSAELALLLWYLFTFSKLVEMLSMAVIMMIPLCRPLSLIPLPEKNAMA